MRVVTNRVDLTQAQVLAIAHLVDGRISQNDSVLESHSHDESAFPPVLPSAVVSPNSTAEVSSVLSYCNAEGIPVVAFGAGTSLEGHVVPSRGGISLDLTSMNRILEIRPDDLLVRVETGVARKALNEKLSSYGLFFSVDPGADATLGGMAATGAAGTTTVRYGSMRENVMAMTAVLADGTVIRTGRETRKQSAGFDLTRLLVGSEGTLAVITELTLRLFGIPEKMAAAVVCFPDLARGVAAATAIVRSGVAIARCEFLDKKCITNLNKLEGLSLAEAPTLLFEFHGSPQSVKEDANTVQEIVADFDGTDFEWTAEEGQRRKLWQARHNAHYAALAMHPGKKGVSTDWAVPLSRLADAVGAAERVLSAHSYPYSFLGHVADGNFHAQIINDPSKPNELNEIREITHSITSEIIAMGGTCTGEHGIGGGKMESLVEEAGRESVEVMRAIKRALDPNYILNPDKIFTEKI